MISSLANKVFPTHSLSSKTCFILMKVTLSKQVALLLLAFSFLLLSFCARHSGKTKPCAACE